MEILEVVRDSLLLCGAEVEVVDEAKLCVLAPEELQTQLGVKEFSIFDFSVDSLDDAVAVGPGSDIVRWLPQALKNSGRSLSGVLPESLRPSLAKSESYAALLEKLLVLDNATYRFLDVSENWLMAHVGLFHFTALSDDKRAGIISVAVNAANLNYIEIDEARYEEVLQSVPLKSLVQARELAALDLRASTLVREQLWLLARNQVKDQLTHFISGMQRRMQRDLDRLYDYYSQLWQETQPKAQQDKIAAKSLLDLKQQAIERDYSSKTIDIRHHYSLSVKLELVQLARLLVPVKRIAFQILRRKHQRKAYLDLHPLAIKPRMLRCEKCAQPTRQFRAQDEGCALLCKSCYVPIVACGSF